MDTNLKLYGQVKAVVTDQFGAIKQELVKNNTVVKAGEDFLIKFFDYLNSSKYDAGDGATQAGYMDVMSIGTGFKTDAATAGNTTTIVLPYKPIGVADAETTAFDGKTVTILSGANQGEAKIVATTGYNPSNAGFGNKPTLTVTVAFSNAVAVGVQVSVGTSLEENGLQGEATADGAGVTLTTATQHRVVVTSKTVQANANEIILVGTWGTTLLTGGSSIQLCEVGLHNNTTNGVGVTPSGNMFAKVEFGSTPINKGPTDNVTITWTFRFGTAR